MIVCIVLSVFSVFSVVKFFNSLSASDGERREAAAADVDGGVAGRRTLHRAETGGQRCCVVDETVAVGRASRASRRCHVNRRPGDTWW